MDGIPNSLAGLSRPGLPLDPLLQLVRGSLSSARTVTQAGAGGELAWTPNPLRVAVYVVPVAVAATWVVSPLPSGYVPVAVREQTFAPVAIHVRDFPGMPQTELYLCGTVGDQWAVWDYTLFD